MLEPPRIDSRHAADIERETRELLLRYLREDTDWPGRPYSAVESKGPLAAMIGVFGRFAEAIIDRINRSPQRNFLAFLDLIGVSRRYPQPARVPLTFGLAAGTTHPATVRKGTQAAAQPAKNQTQPAIFETERELIVSPVKMVAAHMMDHGHDRYYSWLPLLGQDVLNLQEVSPVEHVVYLGLGTVLDPQTETQVELSIVLERPVRGTRTIVWEVHTAQGWVVLQPAADETANLSRSGVVRFAVPPAEGASVNSITNRWVRASLKTPIEDGLDLPSICSISTQAAGGKTDLLPAAAFVEYQAIDLTRDFFPFGTSPAFGSTFYISNPEALSVDDAEVTLHVTLTNPAAGGAEPPIPRVNAAGKPQLAWEFSNGTRWVTIGISQTGVDQTEQYPHFEDTTRAFTMSGTVKLSLPGAARPMRVNGMALPWLRVRLISGDYGVAPQLERQGPVKGAPVAPPAIHAITFEYRIARTQTRPERILDWNDFKWTDQTGATGCFQPFRSDKNLPLAIYFGFEPPPVEVNPFGTRSISLYLVLSATASLRAETLPSVEWQYWNGTGWKKWTVRDETNAIQDSGPVRFLPPGDFARRSLFAKPVYWLRIVWTGHGPTGAPVSRILLNTVMAVNAETIESEILGSSNGLAGQVFPTLRSPVLEGPVVEVREPQRPPAEERARLEREEGPDAIRIVPDEDGGDSEIWVRWHEVPDFLESMSLDRHYLVDHINGEVVFGDNIHGMIPPIASGSIQASYRTGGGVSGNRQPGEINALKTTVPYIDRVYNYENSEGGVDAEDERELPERGATVLRHRNRAVAREDYQDLAMLASAEVGRAKCLAARDLAADPGGKVVRPGAVSVIVVPRSAAPKPVPSAALLEVVRDYLDARRVPAAELSIVGPDYVRIDVEVEIGLDSLDSGDVELAVTLQLQAYLHPLTGGPHNTGWQFGRRVRASELYKVIEPIPGIRYVSRLEVTEKEEREGAILTDLFLIYSGIHTVHLFLPEN